MIPPLPHKYLGSDKKRREETQGTFYLWNRSGYGKDYRAEDFRWFLFHLESSGVEKSSAQGVIRVPLQADFEKGTYPLWQFQWGEGKGLTQRDLRRWLVASGEAALRSVV